jgi:hypothetical protein
MMRRFLTTGFPSALLALTAGFATQAEAGPILDGGFESATVSTYAVGPIGDGWIVTQGTIDIENNGIFGRAANSGAQFAYLDDSNTVNTISQTIATIVGQSYSISYWVADNQPNSLSSSFGGTTLFSGTAPTNGFSLPADYVNYNFVATATSTSTILSFTGQWLNIGADDNGTQLDDVSVTAASVPEPATLGFTALGCLALFTARRLLKTPAPRG